MRRVQLVVASVVVVISTLVLWKLRCQGSDGDPLIGSSTSGGAAHARGGRGAAAEPASLGGRITKKAGGGGIAGAVVAIAPADLGEMFRRGDKEKTVVVTTDATGAYSVPVIPAGTYSVAATAKGFLPAMQDKLVVAAGAHGTADLALAAGGTVVSGTVSDVTGGPVGGARVTMTRESTIFTGRGQLVALTGADGRYELTLAPGEYMALASHEDYTTTHQRFELAGEPLVIDFALAPGSSVRGIVVTRDGKPVPDARVTAQSSNWRRSSGGEPATTDDSGHFQIKSLGSGAIKLTAVARGFRSPSPTVVELGIGEQIDGIRIVVDKALSIHGRVVRAGKPTEGVPDVEVGIFSMASGENATSIDPSDATGAFEIVGVKPGSYMAFAFGERVMPEIGKPVEVLDKDVDNFVIEMSVGATLSGRVDPGAVAGMKLELAKEKIGIGNMFQAIKTLIVRAESDESGVFTLKNVPAGEFNVVATASDGRKGKLAVTVTDADQQGLVVKLEARASLSGRVVDANGAAVAGVHVNVAPALELKSNVQFSFDDDRGGDSALTGPTGGFKVVGLDPGKMKVTVSDDQGRIPWAKPAKADKPDEPVEVELAKGQDTGNVTLTVEARDGVIRGTVVDKDHKPVPDAWVTPHIAHDKKDIDREMVMAEFRSPRQPVLTNADGKFVIDRLRRGTYELIVEGPRGSSRADKKDVKTGDNVTIELEPLGSVTGHVTAGGKPVAEFDLHCRPNGIGVRFEMDEGAGGRHFTSPDGSYTVERLAPGSYSCAASADAGTAAGGTTVASGPSTLDLPLQPWASVTGVVVSALDGKPVPNLFAFAGGDNMDEKAVTAMFTGKGPTTDAQGRFVVERVATGKGKLSIVPRESSFNQLAEREYTASAGQRVDLGTIKVIPPRTGDAGTFGITSTVDDGKLMVASVMPEGPADRAGVKAGDRIVTIDGQQLPEMGLELAQNLLFNGTAQIGQKLALGLERAGQPITVTVVAEKW